MLWPTFYSSNPCLFQNNLSLDSIFSIFFRPLFFTLRPQWLGNTNHLPPCLATLGPTQCLGLSTSSSCLSPWPSQSHANTIPRRKRRFSLTSLPLWMAEHASSLTRSAFAFPCHDTWTLLSLFNSRTPELFRSPGNLTLEGDSDLTESEIFIKVKSRFWLDIARDVYRHSFRHSWSEDESRHLLSLRHPWLLPPNHFWKSWRRCAQWFPIANEHL